MIVKDVMKDAVGVEKSLTLKKASEVMSQKDISSLIVVEGEKVIGVLTQDDMVDNFGDEANVEKAMTKKVISVSPEDSVEDAIDLLKKKKISVLPVIEEEKLVGVVSAGDLIDKSSGGSKDEFLMD